MSKVYHNVSFTLSRDDFLRELYTLMEYKGQPITKVPSLGYRDLDLYHLYKLVIARGGMDEVTRKQEWKTVYQELGIPTMSTSASYNTRTNYKKYLYLYELEHCDFEDMPRPVGREPRFAIGQFIRIVSEVYEGQVFYAQVVKCRYRQDRNVYYVHYNGWSSSHDEWMPEEVLGELIGSERDDPENLQNPAPSRSSKSNRIIEDPILVPGERPLPSISGSGSRIASGQATPPTRKRKNSDASSNSNAEDDTNRTGYSSVDVLMQQRRSGNLTLRGQKAINNALAALISPLDRAPLTPDWDLVKQELLEAEFDDGENQMTLREFHVHHNADTSVPVLPGKVDIEELNWLEKNSFDFEPGKQVLRGKIAKIKNTANTGSHVVPELHDTRSLQEIQKSVDDLQSQLILLERQYKRNNRLLSKLKTDDRGINNSGTVPPTSDNKRPEQPEILQPQTRSTRRRYT